MHSDDVFECSHGGIDALVFSNDDSSNNQTKVTFSNAAQRITRKYERCRFVSSVSRSRSIEFSRPRFCRDTPNRTP